jgi:hypothetical protein
LPPQIAAASLFVSTRGKTPRVLTEPQDRPARHRAPLCKPPQAAPWGDYSYKEYRLFFFFVNNKSKKIIKKITERPFSVEKGGGGESAG